MVGDEVITGTGVEFQDNFGAGFWMEIFIGIEDTFSTGDEFIFDGITCEACIADAHTMIVRK